MDQLPRVIGPAPSELPPGEFLEKLKLERRRASLETEKFRKGGKKSSYAQSLTDLMRKHGISGEELQALIRKNIT